MVSEIHVISFGEIVIRALPPGSYMDDKQLMKETGNSSIHWPQIGTPSPARRRWVCRLQCPVVGDLWGFPIVIFDSQDGDPN
jgi:hypothetical protein